MSADDLNTVVGVMPDATVTITRAEYVMLVRDADKYQALLAAGVDNWEGYGEAMDAYAHDQGAGFN